MKVALGARATWLVGDWSNYSQHSLAVRASKYPSALFSAQRFDRDCLVCESPIGRMASAAGRPADLYFLIYLLLIGRKLDLAHLVIHAYARDHGLFADLGDDRMHLGSMVIQHAVTGAALDGFSNRIGGRVCGFLEIFPLQHDYSIAQNEKDNRHTAQQADG